MSDSKKTSSYQRVSQKNMDRIGNGIGKFGESFDDVLGRLLGEKEDINRCLKGDEPQTDDLRELKVKWCEECIREYLINNSYNE